MSDSEYFLAGVKVLLIQLVLGASWFFLEPHVTWAIWVTAPRPLKLGALLFVLLVLPAPVTKNFRSEMTRRRDEKLRVSSHTLDQFALELVERLQCELQLSGVIGPSHWTLNIPKSSGISFDILISRDSLEWGAIAVNSEGSVWKEGREYLATKGEWPEALQTKMVEEVLAFAKTLLASEVRGTVQQKLFKSVLFVEWKIGNAWQATKITNV